MADTPILLREKQYHQIKAVLARLRMDASARVVFLVDKDGQEIASQGEVGNLDTTSLASLAAGNVAATGGMAQLIGEKEFPTLSHEGEKESIHISVVGRLLLVVVFDERSSLGLVKLRSKQVSQQLAASTTTRPFTVTSRRVFVSMYETPVARPSGPTITSRHMAPVRSSRFPVARAGLICTPGEAKLALTAQARPHSAQ